MARVLAGDDGDGLHRADPAVVVAALASTGTGSSPAAEPRADGLIPPGALAWAAGRAGELADGFLARHPDLTAPAHAVAEQIEALILRILGRVVDADGVTGPPEMTGTTDEAIRHLIAMDVPFARLMESVRFARESVIRDLLDVALTRTVSAADLAALTRAVNRSMDEALDDMAAHYAREAQRFSTSTERTRRELIDELIGGAPVDAATVQEVLGTAIEERHHGFVFVRAAWSRDAHRYPLSRLAGAVTRSLRVPAVVVREQEGELWVWASSPRLLHVDTDRLAAEIGDGVRVGVGSGQPGAAGFRRTHLEAAAAARFRPTPPSCVVDYGRHALAILLSTDRERARWFVESELGELAGPGPRNRELLETLRSYYATKLRVAATAEQLHIHRNTAIQRLNALETMLGHPAGERMTEVQCALSLLDLVTDGDEVEERH